MENVDVFAIFKTVQASAVFVISFNGHKELRLGWKCFVEKICGGVISKSRKCISI